MLRKAQVLSRGGCTLCDRQRLRVERHTVDVRREYAACVVGGGDEQRGAGYLGGCEATSSAATTTAEPTEAEAAPETTAAEKTVPQGGRVRA